MKPKLYMILIIVASTLLLAGCQQQKDTLPVHERKGLLNDYAAIFNTSQTESLTSDLEEYEKDTCHQIFILTIPSLNGEKISDFSARTAQAWKIGQDIMNNGVLLTMAMQEGKVRIEAGAGLDFIIKEGAAKTIINQEMVPEFRQDRIFEGINKGIQAIKAAASAKTYPTDHRPAVCR